MELSGQADGVALTFRLVPRPNLFLREVRMEPHTFGISLKVPSGALIDAARAREIAAGVESQLATRGYHDARVTGTLVPAGKGRVDLRLRVDPGVQVRVKEIRFEGEVIFRSDLRAMRKGRPLPTREVMDADITRMRSHYLANGFLDADVRPGDVEIHGKNASVTIFAHPGAQSSIPPRLCSTLLTERRNAQLQGVLDFTARYDAKHGLSVDRGKPYRVGRIEFFGNHHYGDATLRRNFYLDEGDLFDERKLRRSVARLNRTGLFENIDEKNVMVQPDETTGYARITVRVAERKRSAWNISGPVGPLSLAGPLQASITTRMPVWSTWMLSVGMFAFARPLLPILNAPKRFTPIFYLQRSGFTIAPQLGWKYTAAAYANSRLQSLLLPATDWRRLDADRPAGHRETRLRRGRDRLRTARPAPPVAAFRSRNGAAPVRLGSTITGMRAALCFLGIFASALVAQPRFDVLITGAKIVDGSGGAWFYADIGISGDTIAAVGQPARCDGGHAVSTRAVWSSPRASSTSTRTGGAASSSVPTAENYLREGVTTLIEGPDGSSPLPLAPFLDGIRKTPISINFATFVGQGTIRAAGHRLRQPQGDAGRDREDEGHWPRRPCATARSASPPDCSMCPATSRRPKK